MNTVVEVIVGDGAKLEYVTVQDHHSETRQFATHRVTVGRDAKLDWVAAAVGGTRAKSRMESYLAGQGAQVKVTGAYYLTGARAHRLRHDPGARRSRHDLATWPSRACWTIAPGRSGEA